MSSAIFIDGNSLLHRAFYALPTTMKTKDGRYTNAVYGFINMLLTLTSKYSPEYIAVAFDVKKHTFRNDMYDQYKAGRRSTPFELADQFPLIREVLKKLDIKYIELEGYEGDDVLGTLSLRAEEQGIFTYLVTGDKDALQLVSNHCHVLMTKKGVSEIEEYSAEHLKEVYGLTPKQITDLKGLMGDSSDNIPGVAGVGEKTALKLLNQFGSVEELYQNIETLPKNKLYEKLVKDKDSAFLSKELATIKIDVPLSIQTNELRFEGFDDESLLGALTDLEFTSMIRRLGLQAQPKPSVKTIDIKSMDEIEAVADKLYKKGIFAFYLDGQRAYFGDGTNEYAAEFTNDLFGEGIDEQGAFKAFAKLFEAPQVKLYLHSAKALYHILFNYDIKCCSLVHDTQIAAYVLNPTRRKFDLGELKSEYDVSGYSSAIYAISQIQRKKLKTTA